MQFGGNESKDIKSRSNNYGLNKSKSFVCPMIKNIFLGRSFRIRVEQPKTIFALRKNQLSSFYYLCGTKMVLGRSENNLHNFSSNICKADFFIRRSLIFWLSDSLLLFQTNWI
jgi:hypothetical protein